jgi:nicotinic acid mononucleotide adenylyltransferase
VRIGAYPGSFDPLTVAHLAIVESAIETCDLDRVDLVLSEVALGKSAHHVHLADRFTVLRRVAERDARLGATVTGHRLLVDIASGYDVLVMGADKWAQVNDPAWYDSPEARDAALAALPAVAVAPRPGFPVPEGVVRLDVEVAHGEVSSTAVRSGAHDWMAPEAAELATATGAWIDPARYARWLEGDA